MLAIFSKIVYNVSYEEDTRRGGKQQEGITPRYAEQHTRNRVNYPPTLYTPLKILHTLIFRHRCCLALPIL